MFPWEVSTAWAEAGVCFLELARPARGKGRGRICHVEDMSNNARQGMLLLDEESAAEALKMETAEVVWQTRIGALSHIYHNGEIRYRMWDLREFVKTRRMAVELNREAR